MPVHEYIHGYLHDVYDPSLYLSFFYTLGLCFYEAGKSGDY